MKKFLALALAVIMVLALSVPAWAAGTNSITVSGAQNGEKYNIYRMLDLTVDSESNPTSYQYTINSKWNDFWTTGAGAAYIDTNTVGSKTYVVWKSDKQTAADMETFAKAAAAYAAENSIEPDGEEQTAASDTAGWTGLDNGYYLVTSTYGTAASVASTPTNPAETIREKNNENSSDKEVQEAAERNGTSATWPESNANDAAIGDTILFRAKISIAKNTTGLVYHDTMTAGLTWTGASATKVYTDEVCTTELDSSYYSVAAGTSPETFTVTFTEAYLASLTAATTDVWVGYSAVLNDDATVDTTGQTNTGKVTWGENGEGTPTTTTTTTHKFELLKFDGTDTDKNPLAGAKFQLFTAESGGTALTLAKNAAGTIYRVVDTSDVGASLPDGFTLVADNKIVTLDSGNITIEGVDSDDYWLEETDAPLGYNKLDGRTKVQVDAANNTVSEVENNSGTTLPSTGGIGTTIFYVLGGLLVVFAGVLLITKTRMNKEQ